MNSFTITSRFSRLLFVLLFGTLPFALQPVVAQEATPATSQAQSCAALLGVGAAGDACVSVVHASPDAPNVDIFIDGELALSNLGFGWWSEWLALPAGEYQIQVTATGEPIETAVIDATLQLEDGVAYQVAATGFLAEIAPQVFEINLSGMTEGSARVQVMHAVPDAPAVDVALTGGDVLLEGLAFPMASGVLDVPAGSYDLEVRLAGAEDVVLPLPGTELAADTLYQVYAIGSVEGGEIVPFVISTPIHSGSSTSMTSEGCAATLGIGMDSDACVNVIHASPDAPNVDVWVNGEPALTNVAFQEFSGWLALPAGEYHVVVTPTGESTDQAVIDATLMLEAGIAYHVAAIGTVANIQPAVIEADLSSTTDAAARVRVIHASPDAPAVDIAITDGDVLIPGLAFGAASDYLEVPAGSYNLEVRVAGTTDVALALPATALDGNVLYDIIAVGSVADGTLTVVVVPSMTMNAE